MCGFLGEIGDYLIDDSEFKQLLSLSYHRGPDQLGIWSDKKNCRMGFNRLSILDLSVNGKQPLLSPSGKFALLFNGEIYNYVEIQVKYNIAKKDLRSTSDSEVLAHLIEKVSIDVFAKELNGMFAIIIYNIEHKKLHFLRDFAGIKPLFYGLHPSGIVFASQFNQVYKHPLMEKELDINAQVLKEYFALGYMQAPNTIYKNIHCNI